MQRLYDDDDSPDMVGHDVPFIQHDIRLCVYNLQFLKTGC